MLIRLENSWSHADGDVAELEWLDDYLSAPTTRYEQGKGWVEERYRMLSQVGHRFASGLVPMVHQASGPAGHCVHLDDARGPAGFAADAMADVAWLRDYQRQAHADLLRAGRGICWAPTGSGKTELIVALTRSLPCEHLMLCHRTDLVDQAAGRYLLRTGERAGSFDSRGWARGSCNFTVATFQSVFSSIKRKSPAVRELLAGVQCLHVDEVHGQAAASYYRVTQMFERARHRFGFSGTPLHRGDVDALRTIGAIGPVVARVTYDQLIAAGVLAKPRVTMVELHQRGPMGGGSWRDVYSTLVVRSKRRNRLLAEMAEACAKPCLLFVDEVQQGEHVVKHLRAAGLRAEFVHGGHPAEHRRASLKGIAGGDLDVLVCTVIFQEGIDVPSLRGIVVGGGKASTVACLQRVGRGMRKAPGKDWFEVWDVRDVGQEWLARHADDRRNALVEAGIRVTQLGRLQDAWEPREKPQENLAHSAPS